MLNHPGSSLRLIAIALLGSALLSACGGGGEDAPRQPVAAARPTAVLAEVATVADNCGIASLASQVAGGQTGLNINSLNVDSDGYVVPVTYLVSGDYYETQARMDVLLPQSDLRAPVVYLEPGANTMGVAMTGPYLLGSVACVKSVGRASAEPSPITQSYEMTWASSTQPVLPIQTLPHPPVNGFEYFGNFDAQNPSAVFHLASNKLTDPAEARICRYEGGTAWACVVPQANLEGTAYIFSTPMSAKGVYVLSVPSAPLF